MQRFLSLDYLRLIAAVAVLYGHSYALMGYQEPSFHIFSDLDPSYLAVNFFFFLSGYLMSGALLRSKSQMDFIINRLSRIMPGLVVCVILTQILGFTVTSYDAFHYFTAVEFFKYFGNVFFIFRSDLPGVFVDNPYPLVVNGSLWTLFYEMICYGVLTFFIPFGKKNRDYILLFLAAVCIFYLTFFKHSGPTFGSNLSRLVFLFLCGYLFGNYGRGIRYYFVLFAVLYIYYIFDGGKQPEAGGILFSVVLCSILLSVVLRFDGLFPSLPFDCSYGIYIYSFPIQQLLISLQLGLDVHQLFFCSFLFALPVAVISWFYVEVPGMKRIKKIKKLFKFSCDANINA